MRGHNRNGSVTFAIGDMLPEIAEQAQNTARTAREMLFSSVKFLSRQGT